MGITVKIDEQSFGNIVKKLEAVADYDKKKFLDNMGMDALRISNEAFKTKIDPNDGSKWEESQASKGRGSVNTTLVDSSILMGSIDYISNTASGSVDVGTNIKYGKKHQEGKRYYISHDDDEGNSLHMPFLITIPRRRFLGVPPTFAQEQAEEIIRALRL